MQRQFPPPARPPTNRPHRWLIIPAVFLWLGLIAYVIQLVGIVLGGAVAVWGLVSMVVREVQSPLELVSPGPLPPAFLKTLTLALGLTTASAGELGRQSFTEHQETRRAEALSVVPSCEADLDRARAALDRNDLDEAEAALRSAAAKLAPLDSLQAPPPEIEDLQFSQKYLSEKLRAIRTDPNRCPDGTRKRAPKSVSQCNRTCSGIGLGAMALHNCLEKCRCPPPAPSDVFDYELDPKTCKDGRTKLDWKDSSLGSCNRRCNGSGLSAADVYDCMDACRCPKPSTP